MRELEPCVFQIDFFLSKDMGETMPGNLVRPGLPSLIVNQLFHKYKAKASKDDVEKLVAEADLPDRSLVLLTENTYHHLTYGLVKGVEEEDIGYIHIDNHHDAANLREKGEENLLFSSFVSDIGSLDSVSSILLIGAYYHSLDCISDEVMEKEDWREILREKLDDFPDKVYVSIDLDILDKSLMETSFGQGVLDLNELEDLIEIIREEKEVVAGDIYGLEKPLQKHEVETYKKTAAMLI